MSSSWLPNSWRGVFGAALAAAACGIGVLAAAAPYRKETTMTATTTRLDTAQAATDSIRPFRISVPEPALADLRRRIAATRWPDKETVPDQSQGAPLARLQALVQYWGSGYNWRKAEGALNALPQFVTTIDGVDVQFIQVKSRHPNALPVLITHGWPGSVFEFLGTIAPLTDPVAHGGTAADAFDVVIPSIPGYGFSGKPTTRGGAPGPAGRAGGELINRLAYVRCFLGTPPRGGW